VYPVGVSGAQQSDRLKAMSVLLYVLGLSYGGVADFLSALGHPLGKTTVYENVQATGVASRQRQANRPPTPRTVIGADATYFTVQGEKIGVQVVVDDMTNELLGLEIISSERQEHILPLIRQIAEAYQAEVMVSDDWGSYQAIADELGLAHQICRTHVKRNVDQRAERIRHRIALTPLVPDGVDSDAERLEQDVQALQDLIRQRPDDANQRLQTLYHRYQAAVPPPKANQTHSAWYLMRLLIVHLWDRWQRLTLDQRRDDLDGTNNSCERLIGWWFKERSRTMRGYKRTESIRNVGTLTCTLASATAFDMACLFA
jgi:transposase-like protein